MRSSSRAWTDPQSDRSGCGDGQAAAIMGWGDVTAVSMCDCGDVRP